VNIFGYSKSQLAFLSDKALKHLRHSQLPFQITLSSQPDDQINFGLNDLFFCFKEIDSLFPSETEIIFTENNLHIREDISTFLDKRSLLKVCKSAGSNVSPTFKLSSKHFKFLYENDLAKLNDFKLIVNDRTFDINFSLFCCVSNKFQSMNHREEELSLIIPNQHLPCLISFLDIFKGIPFYYENYSLESVSYLINVFGLSSLSQFMCKNLPSPQNIQEALEFLSNHFCELFPNIFDESLAILIHHFSDIRLDQFLKLSNFVLEQLFQSPQFQIDNENILFNLVVDLIGRDPNRKILLKLIYFPYVSTPLLINFFANLPVEEIDSDLFDSLKARLFCEVCILNSLLSSRWRNAPSLRSREEIEDIFNISQDHFLKTSNLVESIKKFNFC
jgi:hypothetical protein